MGVPSLCGPTEPVVAMIVASATGRIKPWLAAMPLLKARERSNRRVRIPPGRFPTREDRRMAPMAIAFPGIDPVAIALGPLQIRWYGLAYLTGLVLGWLYMRSLLRQERL